MPKRSDDWHVSGWPAVLLAPIAIPIVLLINVAVNILGLKKTRDRTVAEVAGFIRDFIEGTGGEWDWDDFVSVPITNPELEKIRAEADSVMLPVDDDGFEKLKGLLKRVEAFSR
jgi:hypothetical protein